MMAGNSNPIGRREKIISLLFSLGMHLTILGAVLFFPANFFDPSAKPDRWTGSGQTEVRSEQIPAPITASEPFLHQSLGAVFGWRHPQGSTLFGRNNLRLPQENQAELLPTPVGRPPRNLADRIRPAVLAAPEFSANTIPPKPERSMWQVVGERAEEFLGGDVYREAVPLQIDPAVILAGEERFIRELADDLADGWLDMDFADFIIPAEYYRLFRALVAENRQPTFTLAEARRRFQTRLARVGADLPGELDAFTLVMILQRYAEDKYYPENGSGMLLDSLFHNLADCESGSLEIIAYLDQLYPGLTLGTNRGMIPTTDGRLIGHMQVYLSPDQRTRRILDNSEGLVIEATRVDRDSISRWETGDRYPLEDFVYRFYPQLNTRQTAEQPGQTHRGLDRPVVGASNHPLKMDYELPTAVIGDRPLDLALLQRQKIVNGFQTSQLPSCDPGVNPEKVDRSNLFSNLVAIDPSLRKPLVMHYLADLDYWDNQVMPNWKLPEFLASYSDLRSTLLDTRESEIVLDSGETLAFSQVRDHALLLAALAETGGEASAPADDGQQCAGTVRLDGVVLEYLFGVPEKSGVVLLGDPYHDWTPFLTALLDDCLEEPENSTVLEGWGRLAAQAEKQKISLRNLLYGRILTLGNIEDHQRESRRAVLSSLFQGRDPDFQDVPSLSSRRSLPSSSRAPSVQESLKENGRTGLALELVRDAADFFDRQEFLDLMTAYLQRQDLLVSLERSAGLVDALVGVLGETARTTPTLLKRFGERAAEPGLRLSLLTAADRLSGVDEDLISKRIGSYLRELDVIDLKTFGLLLGFGLPPGLGAEIVMDRFLEDLDKLERIEEDQPGASVPLYRELFAIGAILETLDDHHRRRQLRGRLMEEVGNLFEAYAERAERKGEAGQDYSGLLSRLLLLTRLRGNDTNAEQERFLERYLDFGAVSSFGRMLTDLVGGAVVPADLESFLENRVADQFDRLERMEREAGEDDFRLAETLASEISTSNVVFRFFQVFGESKARDYLLGIHRRVARILDDQMHSLRLGEIPLPLRFYRDRGVMESFSLLATLALEPVDDSSVKFRTIKDIRRIKDMNRVRVIEDGRKITRQDMSQLTLALNPANSLETIARSWQETVGVIPGHRQLAANDRILQRYLFAPHAPYLVENDFGFFYTPALIADLRNAANWGGKNDILLSSYLHFRNMVGELPPWLLEAAAKRARFEKEIMERFRSTSFLPMILECTADAEVMPDPLFRAKWTIRKPYGEDIMPATLLLVRLGYMDFSPEGELVLTEKYPKM